MPEGLLGAVAVAVGHLDQTELDEHTDGEAGALEQLSQPDLQDKFGKDEPEGFADLPKPRKQRRVAQRALPRPAGSADGNREMVRLLGANFICIALQGVDVLQGMAHRVNQIYGAEFKGTTPKNNVQHVRDFQNRNWPYFQIARIVQVVVQNCWHIGLEVTSFFGIVGPRLTQGVRVWLGEFNVFTIRLGLLFVHSFDFRF